MANTITRQTLNDGEKNLTVKVHIVGDGSGEETNTVLIDASTYSPVLPTNARLMRTHSHMSGFTAELLWDATANVPAINIPDYDESSDFSHIGGLKNNAGAGVTGDVLITTTGLGAGDKGTIILTFSKQ